MEYIIIATLLTIILSIIIMKIIKFILYTTNKKINKNNIKTAEEAFKELGFNYFYRCRQFIRCIKYNDINKEVIYDIYFDFNRESVSIRLFNKYSIYIPSYICEDYDYEASGIEFEVCQAIYQQMFELGWIIKKR